MQQIELEIGSVVDITSKPGKIVLKAFFIPIPCSKNNCHFQRSSLRLEKLSQQRGKLAAGRAPVGTAIHRNVLGSCKGWGCGHLGTTPGDKCFAKDALHRAMRAVNRFLWLLDAFKSL
jgi:hypothetical protein